MKRKEKYVVLENLSTGERFFSTNNLSNNCYSVNGELWYKEITFTDDSKEVQDLCNKYELKKKETF